MAHQINSHSNEKERITATFNNTVTLIAITELRMTETKEYVTFCVISLT